MYRRRGAYGVRKAAAQAQSSSTVLAIALMLFAIALALATTALAGMCDQLRSVRAFNGSNAAAYGSPLAGTAACKAFAKVLDSRPMNPTTRLGDV